jgi:hypothetical protein
MADFVEELVPPKHTCSTCDAQFSSRNKLFKHVALKTCAEAATMVADDLSGLVLYACGGRDRGITLNSCERLDLGGGDAGATWTSIAELQSPRGSHVVCAVEGKVYALGGGGVHSNLAVCEVTYIVDDYIDIVPAFLTSL